MTKKEKIIFEALFIDSKLFNTICQELQIKRNKLTEYNNHFLKKRMDEINQIRRIRKLYNLKKEKNIFKFKNFKDFYTWYIEQYKKQKGKCYYCKIDEFKITKLFSSEIFTSKRSVNRGHHLEVERKNVKNNDYSRDNCVLACYFCNNDKSDVINEKDYFDYLKNRKKFLDKKFKKI